MRTENLYYYGLDRLETGGIFSEKDQKKKKRCQMHKLLLVLMG